MQGQRSAGYICGKIYIPQFFAGQKTVQNSIYRNAHFNISPGISHNINNNIRVLFSETNQLIYDSFNHVAEKYINKRLTPKEIVARWNQELVKVLSAPDVREQLLGHGLEPMPGTAEELARHIEREHATWGRVVKEAKITAN